MDRQQPYSLTNQLTDEEKQILSDWKKMRSVCKDREDCLFGNYPTLQEMNNNCRGSGLAAISKCLDLMNVYTNYRAKLNLMQTLMLSQTIFDKFFYLKETELMLFFSDFYKYMNSDEFYGSIEPKTITTMLTNCLLQTWPFSSLLPNIVQTMCNCWQLRSSRVRSLLFLQFLLVLAVRLIKKQMS